MKHAENDWRLKHLPTKRPLYLGAACMFLPYQFQFRENTFCNSEVVLADALVRMSFSFVSNC